MTIKEQQGFNEINRYNLYPTAPIQAASGAGLQHRSSHSGDPRGCRRDVVPHGDDMVGQGLSYDESRKGNESVYIFLIVVRSCVWCVGQYEKLHLAAGGDSVAADWRLRLVFLAGSAVPAAC